MVAGVELLAEPDDEPDDEPDEVDGEDAVAGDDEVEGDDSLPEELDEPASLAAFLPDSRLSVR